MKRWYEESLGLRLVRAARRHRARAGEILRDLDLHPGQETVLLALLETDGQAMSELAATLDIRPPTLTRMVARMTTLGLLQRRVAPDDRRRATIHLSEEGRRRAGELKRRWKALERAAFGKLGDKDRRRLGRLLASVEDALASAPAGRKSKGRGKAEPV